MANRLTKIFIINNQREGLTYNTELEKLSFLPAFLSYSYTEHCTLVIKCVETFPHNQVVLCNSSGLAFKLTQF